MEAVWHTCKFIIHKKLIWYSSIWAKTAEMEGLFPIIECYLIIFIFDIHVYFEVIYSPNKYGCYGNILNF